MKDKIYLNTKDKQKGLILPKGMTIELAHILGVFAGDGSLGHREHKKEYSLKCVGNPKDEKEFYQQVIIPEFSELFGFKPTAKYFDRKTTYGFSTYSKVLVQYLVKEGLPLGKKWVSLHIPLNVRKDRMFVRAFIQGVFDTDGCICFKKRYRKVPYYPTISFSSKSKPFTKEIAEELKKEGFKIVEIYDYKLKDSRAKQGFTIINKVELNGVKNLKKWIKTIGFSSQKHLKKIKNSEG